MEMSKELQRVIENAKKSTLEYDGLDKVIFENNKDEYSFCRNFDGALGEGEQEVGIVKAYWENGSFKAKYYSLRTILNRAEKYAMEWCF